MPELATPPVESGAPLAEFFDDNAVTISGTISRIYMQDAHDIVCRIRSQGATATHHISLLFIAGRPLEGSLASLAPGVRLCVQGHLVNHERVETYADVLKRAGLAARIQPGDESISIHRNATYVVVERLLDLPKGEEEVNEARLKGIIWRVWRLPRQSHVFARLAVYDAHTRVLTPPLNPMPGSRTLPRREAHYASVMFPGGQTADGLHVAQALKPRSHLLVTGHLRNIDYSRPLAQILKDAKRPDRITEDDQNARVGTSVTYLIGEQAVILSSPRATR